MYDEAQPSCSGWISSFNPAEPKEIEKGGISFSITWRLGHVVEVDAIGGRGNVASVQIEGTGELIRDVPRYCVKPLAVRELDRSVSLRDGVLHYTDSPLYRQSIIQTVHSQIS